MNKKQFFSLVIGIAISAITLYLAFRNVPFSDLVAYFKKIDYLWILPAIICCIVSFLLRAYRWQLLLSETCKLPFFRLYHPMMIGFMLNCILPGRVGELVRPVIFSKRESVSFATAVSTIAAERVFDLLMLLALLAAVLGVVKIDPDLVYRFGGQELSRETLMAIAGGMGKLCFVVVFGIACLQVTALREGGKRLMFGIVEHTPGLPRKARKTIRQKVADPIARIVDQFAEGFALVRRPLPLVLCLLLSAGVWLLQVLPYWLVAQGSPGIQATFFELTAVMVIVSFFIALPSVPGFWGLWEAGGVFALGLFGIAGGDAAGFTLLIHAVLMFPVIFMGGISALTIGFRPGAVSPPPETKEAVHPL